MGAHLLEVLGILEETRLELNTLGDTESRQRYRQMLLEHFGSYRGSLSKDSEERLERGSVLRILDSKEEDDVDAIVAAPSILEALNVESMERYEAMKRCPS